MVWIFLHVFKVIVIYGIHPYPQIFYRLGATQTPPGTYFTGALVNRELAIVENVPPVGGRSAGKQAGSAGRIKIPLKWGLDEPEVRRPKDRR
jgi:hypothetical protein